MRRSTSWRCGSGARALIAARRCSNGWTRCTPTRASRSCPWSSFRAGCGGRTARATPARCAARRSRTPRATGSARTSTSWSTATRRTRFGWWRGSTCEHPRAGRGAQPEPGSRGAPSGQAQRQGEGLLDIDPRRRPREGRGGPDRPGTLLPHLGGPERPSSHPALQEEVMSAAAEPQYPIPPDEPYRTRHSRTFIVTVEVWEEGDLPTAEQVEDALRDDTTASVKAIGSKWRDPAK